jgi:hypothetical protein
MLAMKATRGASATKTAALDNATRNAGGDYFVGDESISDLETATPGKRRLISSALRSNGIRMEKNFKA